MRKSFISIANLAVAAMALCGLVETSNGLLAIASAGVFFSEFLFFWRRRVMQSAVRRPAIGEDRRNGGRADHSEDR